jgi:hypothetical protein
MAPAGAVLRRIKDGLGEELVSSLDAIVASGNIADTVRLLPAHDIKALAQHVGVPTSGSRAAVATRIQRSVRAAQDAAGAGVRQLPVGRYTSPAGTTLEVFEDGKGFVTRRHFPATRHSPAEIVEKKHTAFSAVERLIKKHGFSAE